MKKILFSILLLIVGIAGAALPAHADDYPIKTCVVTGDPFGGDLGPPIDVTYKGRKVRLCCKSCVKKFNANPDKYMAILDSESAKKK